MWLLYINNLQKRINSKKITGFLITDDEYFWIDIKKEICELNIW